MAERNILLQSDMMRLDGLVRSLHRRVPYEPIDQRALDLIGGEVAPATAEQHLRAIGVLLMTLETYLRGVRRPVRCEPRASERPSASEVSRNGTSPASVPDRPLAAAAARYIARDLAARQLSEFTSAEGYRLARELATLGGAEEAVEQLLAKANKIRLHPGPLTEALSHSAH